MLSDSMFLDIDPTILENKLLLKKESEVEKDLRDAYAALSGQSSTTVRPAPGFCLKARQQKSDQKVFINICTTPAIPAPRNISVEALLELFEGDDEDTIPDYRVPMSIGELRTDVDRKNVECSICDIAINDEFFKRVEEEEPFKRFLIAVAYGAIDEKFGIKVEDERIILKNKKAMGTLQEHRIRKREESGADSTNSLKKLLPDNPSGQKPLIVEMTRDIVTPNYRLFRKESNMKQLIAEIYLPYICNPNEINLDLGRDRILLDTSPSKYFLDIFHEYSVNTKTAQCSFDKKSKFLTIIMDFDTDLAT